MNNFIHQIWLGENSPDIPMSYTWRRHNPAWHFLFWHDMDAETLFKAHYPEFFEIWKNYPLVAKTDSLRYFILFHFGGLYADVDTVCLNAIPIMGNLNFTHLIREPQINGPLITNCVMYAPQGSPFMRYAMHRLPDYKDKGGDLEKASPPFLTDIYHEYGGSGVELHPERRVMWAGQNSRDPEINAENLNPGVKISYINHLGHRRESIIAPDTLAVHFNTSLWNRT